MKEKKPVLTLHCLGQGFVEDNFWSGERSSYSDVLWALFFPLPCHCLQCGSSFSLPPAAGHQMLYLSRSSEFIPSTVNGPKWWQDGTDQYLGGVAVSDLNSHFQPGCWISENVRWQTNHKPPAGGSRRDFLCMGQNWKITGIFHLPPGIEGSLLLGFKL